jgi:hypothetical protein
VTLDEPELPPTQPVTLDEPELPPTEPVTLDEPELPPTGFAAPPAAGASVDDAEVVTVPIAEVGATGFAPPAGSPVDGATATEPLPAQEAPPLFDGHEDLAAFAAPREPFRLRVSFVLALFGAAAVLMAIVADVVDLRTTRPVSGIATGSLTLDDLGTNLALAGFTAAALMVAGALLGCFGLRWGAGLAGGAGLALLGWAGLTIGLAELPIAVAESITRTSSEEFTLRVTRDLGWWLVGGAGVIGLFVFVASVRSIGTGGFPALNPLVAALTAVATVVVGLGPLVPVGDASFSDNFRSTDPNFDLPTAFFAGRLLQVGLIAVAGAVGMLIVRNYGLGLAAGGLGAAVWLWIASLARIGDEPVGIADRNPGAETTEPHAITSVGLVTALVLLVVAAGWAVVRARRTRTA